MKLCVDGAGYVGFSLSVLLSEKNEIAIYDIDKENNLEVLDADDTIKNNAFIIKNKDVIYQRAFSSLVPYYIQDGIAVKRIIWLCKVKDALRQDKIINTPELV